MFLLIVHLIDYFLFNEHLSGHLALIHHLTDIYLDSRYGLSGNAGP